jgi:hypothetical protein
MRDGLFLSRVGCVKINNYLSIYISVIRNVLYVSRQNIADTSGENSFAVALSLISHFACCAQFEN